MRPPVGVSSPVSTQRTSTPEGQLLGRDVLLDQVALVAGAEHEAAQPLGGVDLDHVPEDRLAADLHQRLRDRLGVLLEPRAAAAAEDHHVRDPAHASASCRSSSSSATAASTHQRNLRRLAEAQVAVCREGAVTATMMNGRHQNPRHYPAPAQEDQRPRGQRHEDEEHQHAELLDAHRAALRDRERLVDAPHAAEARGQHDRQAAEVVAGVAHARRAAPRRGAPPRSCRGAPLMQGGYQPPSRSPVA